MCFFRRKTLLIITLSFMYSILLFTLMPYPFIETERTQEKVRERWWYSAFHLRSRSLLHLLLLVLILPTWTVAVALSKTHLLVFPCHYQSHRFEEFRFLVSRFDARTFLSSPKINAGCLKTPKPTAL